MIIKKGKSDWVYIVFTALFAGAVGGGLVSYINDTVWQVDYLAQTTETSGVKISESAPVWRGDLIVPVADTNLEGVANTNIGPVGKAAEDVVKTGEGGSSKGVVGDQEKEFFESFAANPERSDRQIKQTALEIYTIQSDCVKNNPTTLGTGECLADAGKSYDALLEKTYSQKISFLDEQIKKYPEEAGSYKSEKENLAKAMAAWKTYREGICSAEYDDYGGGTARSIAYASCYIAVTLRQIFSL